MNHTLNITTKKSNPLKHKNKVNKEKNYKTTVKEILSDSSIQFLLAPINSKRILIKIINTIFLIVSLCLTSYLIVSNIMDFLKFETNTSINTIYEDEPD